MLAPEAVLQNRNAPNPFSAGAAPWTLLGELTNAPQKVKPERKGCYNLMKTAILYSQSCYVTDNQKAYSSIALFFTKIFIHSSVHSFIITTIRTTDELRNVSVTLPSAGMHMP